MKKIAFVAVCAVSAAGLAAYIYHAKSRMTVSSTPSASGIAAGETAGSAPAPSSSEQSANARPIGTQEPDITAEPRRLFFRYNGVDNHYGMLAFVEPTVSMEPRFIERLQCEVVHVSGGRGLCLTAQRSVVTTYSAILFDSNTFETIGEITLQGIPSRGRVSVDGAVAAATVFVTGHGYTSLDFSTQTLLIDMKRGRVIADVETFAVTRKGQPFKRPDFNFWGVTFTQDAKTFYATLSSEQQHHLVRGNIERKTAEVIHDDVECPSLSPDGKRIAYKKRLTENGRILWQLSVLNLETMQTTTLKEKRSVDDQLEWLDSERVLYAVPETDNDTTPSTTVWVAAADGSRDPEIFLKKAYSPAADRTRVTVATTTAR